MKIFRAIVITPLLAVSLLLCACSGGPNTNVSMYDLQTAMLAADETLPDMISVSSSAENGEELFAYLSDMDYGLVDGFFLSYSSEGLADEIAVIRVKDAKDVTPAEVSLQQHAKNRVRLYETYDPSQTARAEGAVVFTNGSYAVLIICDNPNLVRQAFEDGVL